MSVPGSSLPPFSGTHPFIPAVQAPYIPYPTLPQGNPHARLNALREEDRRRGMLGVVPDGGFAAFGE